MADVIQELNQIIKEAQKDNTKTYASIVLGIEAITTLYVRR